MLTHRLVPPVALFERIAAQHQHRATDTLHHAVAFYAHFYGGRFEHVAAVHGCFGHDVLAFIYLVAPQLFRTQTGQIRVATDGLAQGQTILKRQAGIDYPKPAGRRACPPVPPALGARCRRLQRLVRSNPDAPMAASLTLAPPRHPARPSSQIPPCTCP